MELQTLPRFSVFRDLNTQYYHLHRAPLQYADRIQKIQRALCILGEEIGLVQPSTPEKVGHTPKPTGNQVSGFRAQGFGLYAQAHSSTEGA